MAVRSNRTLIVVMLAILAIIATSCTQGTTPAASGAPASAGASAAASAAATTGAAKRTITVIANWGGGERAAFQKVLDAFTAKTGIPVNYEQSRNLEALVRTRVAGGNPPDIIFEPRPGALAEFAKAGNLIPLDEPVGKEILDPKAVSAALGKSFVDLGRVDGTLYGYMFKADSKSTIWYKPPSLKALGAETPKTIDDLYALADKYKAAGKIPFGSGGKDGWVLTDWFENIYARVATPKQYNDLFVTHKLAWTDPSVKKALGIFAKIFGTPGYFPGGAQGIVGTAFTEGIGQAFSKSPVAEMYYEGGFVGVIIGTDINKDLKAGTDYDFFTFPTIDPAFGSPITGGGDLAVMFKDSPEGRALMQYIITKDAADIYAATGSGTPSKLVDSAKITDPIAKKLHDQVAAATVFLYDGSDLAPSALGGDFLFSALQDLVTKPNDVDRIAQALENFAKSAS
ncbi:MAG TPA: ABC transporter substrate-binding protein [Candidatus Saccharimonadales bacterium]|nr:ABC transporter substrate-binding protein [Candidatus Saccharimonadales bacterium]